MWVVAYALPTSRQRTGERHRRQRASREFGWERYPGRRLSCLRLRLTMSLPQAAHALHALRVARPASALTGRLLAHDDGRRLGDHLHLGNARRLTRRLALRSALHHRSGLKSAAEISWPSRVVRRSCEFNPGWVPVRRKQRIVLSDSVFLSRIFAVLRKV